MHGPSAIWRHDAKWGRELAARFALLYARALVPCYIRTADSGEVPINIPVMRVAITAVVL
jgi:hypothetical protein